MNDINITPLDKYKEQYAHMRAMNDILYKMPPIFTTVIGGLWVFAVNFSGAGKLIPCSVFLFASIASLCFINIVRRFGLAFTLYLNNLNRMDGEYSVSLPQECRPSTIGTIKILLTVACLMSLGGSIYSLVR